MGKNRAQRTGSSIDPNVLTWLLLAVGLGFISLMLLPSIIEILKPEYREPRRILKLPLQRLMRRRPKWSPSISNSVDSTDSLKNLQVFLNKSGVKSCLIGENTLRIFRDVVFPSNSEIMQNIIVLGNLTVGTGCVLHGTAKAKGNIVIGSGVVIKGNLISEGNVDISDDTVIAGLVHSEESVRLGEKVFIGQSVVASGDVELYENSEVKNILTKGFIKTLKSPRLDLPAALEDIG